MSKKRLFIIDSMAMAFRTYHAIRSLTTSKGLPVNAVYGSLLFLWNLIEKEKPDYLVFATDSKEKTFRHDLYPEYKANRTEMPEELAAQIPYLFRLFECLGAMVIKEPGLEADDLIGSLVTRFAGSDLHCYIVSGDKDFMQLVHEHVSLYSPKKGGEVLEVQVPQVFEKFSCRPDQVIDVLALIGDSSDNVPGVHGIGDKGAAKLIQEFHSLEGIYDNLDRVSNQRLRQNLETHRDLAFLSKKLVTIHTEHPLPFQLDDMHCQLETALANPELLKLLEELEFKTQVEKVRAKLKALPNAHRAPPPPDQARRYHCIRSEEDFKLLAEKAASANLICFDTETTGLDRVNDRPIGYSLAFEAGEAFYIPSADGHRLLPLAEIQKQMELILDRPNSLKLAHNIKFDLQMIHNAQVKIQGPFADTMLMSYLLDSTERSHSLDECCLRNLGLIKIPTHSLLDSSGSMLSAPLEQLTEYACEDADYTLQLYNYLKPKLEAAGATSVFENIEMPLAPILAKIEQTGIYVDIDKLSEISQILADRAKELEYEIHQLAGEEFNINSPKQLQVILFEKLKIHEELGLKRLKKTKTGYSTDVSVLEQMESHPLPKALLEFRMISKLKSTYVDTLPQLVDPKTRRLHTHFHQTGTATGRLSSSDPNLQNIPIRSSMGREIRKAFCSHEKDWAIISADYSQVELRVLAALSKDENLRQAFVEGIDIHTSTAAKVFGLSPNEVTKDQRAQAKAINFGIIYGMGPQRLARETGVSMKEAKAFIDRYFETYPAIRRYIDEAIQFARDHEYTQTLSGRRRPLKEINDSRDGAALANAQNIAVNSPVQGTAADLIKLAMIRLQKKLEESPYRAKMLLQVHDELVFECPESELALVMPLIAHEMEQAFDLGVPLKVEVSSGKNWLEAH